MRFRSWFCLLFMVFLAGCGSSDTATRSNNFLPLTSIEVTTANPQIANLTSSQFKAVGNFSGQFTQDITAEVTWSSSDPAVATVSSLAGSNGRAVALTPGVTTISASLDGVTAGSNLTVTAATITSLTISPLTPSVPQGLTKQFSASGTFSDLSVQNLTTDVSWSVLDPLVASISDTLGSKGLAKALAVGITDISATFAGVTTSTAMTVSAAKLLSLSLTPADGSMVSLSKKAYTATGTFSDASTQDLTSVATWVSSVVTVAEIDAGGTVTSLSPGGTSLTASVNGISGSTGLSVTGGNLSSISVGPALTTELANGTSAQFQATGTFDNNTSRDITSVVTWDSSEPLVATISNLSSGPQGRVSTVGAGTTTLTATFDTISQTKVVTVTSAQLDFLTISPLTVDLPLATSQAFTVTGTYLSGFSQDLTLDATWSSSDPTVATITSSDPDTGSAFAVAVGTTTISADFGGVPSAITSLSVSSLTLQSIAITPTTLSLVPGGTQQLTATATYLGGTTRDVTRDVVWSTADSSVADFLDPTGAPGLLTGVDVGLVDLRADFGGQSVTVSADVR